MIIDVIHDFFFGHIEVDRKITGMNIWSGMKITSKFDTEGTRLAYGAFRAMQMFPNGKLAIV